MTAARVAEGNAGPTIGVGSRGGGESRFLVEPGWAMGMGMHHALRTARSSRGEEHPDLAPHREEHSDLAALGSFRFRPNAALLQRCVAAGTRDAEGGLPCPGTNGGAGVGDSVGGRR